MYGCLVAGVMISDIALGKVDGKFDTSTFLITLSPIAATALGVYLWKPEQKMIWFLWFAAWVCLGIGDALGYFKVKGTNTTPSVRDVFYLLEYLYLAAALVLLVWQREDRRDVVATMGASILTIAIISVSFARTLVELGDSGTFLFNAQQLAYVLLEGGFVINAVRLSLSSGEKSTAFWLIIVMAGFVVVGAFTENEMQSILSTGGEPDFGSFWFIVLRYVPAIGLYGVGGMVALHPSMASLSKFSLSRPYFWRWRMEIIIAVAVFVPLVVTVYREPATALRIFGWLGVLTLILRYWIIGYIMFSTYLWAKGAVPKRVDRMIRKMWRNEGR